MIMTASDLQPEDDKMENDLTAQSARPVQEHHRSEPENKKGVHAAASGTILEQWKDRIFLCILILIAAWLRSLPVTALMGRDETSYAFLIKHMIDGSYLNDPVFYSFHPLFPFFASLVARMGVDIELAGRVVSYIMSVAMVLPLYLLGSHLYGRTAGFVAALCCAISPSLINISQSLMSEATYCFLLICSIYWLALLCHSKKPVYAVLTGIALSLAYLTRAEGAIIFIFTLVFVVVTGRWIYRLSPKQILISVSAMILSFLVVASPYLYAIRSNQGSTRLTGKTSAVLKQTAFLITQGSYENMGNVTVSETDLVKTVLANYPEHLKKFILMIPDCYGMLPVLLSIALLLFGNKVGLSRKTLLIFMPFICVIPVIIFFEYAPRHVIPYAPVFFLVASAFVTHLDLRTQHRFPYQVPVILMIFIALALAEGRLNLTRNDPATDRTTQAYQAYRQFGYEITKDIEPGSPVMTRYNLVAWYAGGEYQAIPYSISDFMQQVNNSRVSYVVLGPAERQMRPDIAAYLLHAAKGQGMDKRFTVVRTSRYNDSFDYYLIKVR